MAANMDRLHHELRHRNERLKADTLKRKAALVYEKRARRASPTAFAVAIGPEAMMDPHGDQNCDVSARYHSHSEQIIPPVRDLTSQEAVLPDTAHNAALLFDPCWKTPLADYLGAARNRQLLGLGQERHAALCLPGAGADDTG